MSILPLKFKQGYLPDLLGLSIEDKSAQPDYVRAEYNLETIGYFQASYKRSYPKPKESRILTPARGHTIEIIATAKYGYPNADDMDLYRGFLKICDESIRFVEQKSHDGKKTLHPHLPQPIRFSTNELLQKSGRAKTGLAWKTVKEWIKRNTNTGIEGRIYNAEKDDYEKVYGRPRHGYIELTGRLFLQSYTRGEELSETEVAETNTVWLSPWFLSNYFHHYTKPIDIAFHQLLKTAIAKCLYPLLDQGWYAANGRAFTKKYSDLAEHLGLQTFSHLSRIKQQFEPAHTELMKVGYLKKWEYRKSANLLIAWWPGPKYFEDQKARKDRRTLADNINQSSNGGCSSEESLQLLHDIETWCQAANSSSYFTRAMEDIGIERFRMIFSEARQADTEGRIRTTKKQYLIDLLERYRGKKPFGEKQWNQSIE